MQVVTDLLKENWLIGKNTTFNASLRQKQTQIRTLGKPDISYKFEGFYGIDPFDNLLNFKLVFAYIEFIKLMGRG